MIPSTSSIITLLSIVTGAVAGSAADGVFWNFDHDPAGALPKQFYSATGSWKVRPDATAPSKPNILAQLAKNSRATFNIALVAGSHYTNPEISVKLRSIAGNDARGGGIVWRVKDQRNYYVFRYDPLDGSLALFRVVNNARVELGHVTIMNIAGWHTLRVATTGDRIECYFDGTKYIDRRDSAFPDAGKIGLWTNGDAQTYFDDMKVSGE